MPPLNQTTGLDLASLGYTPATNPGAAGTPPNTNQQPTYPIFQRCPLPPIWISPPDSLRYYSTNNIVPQTRLFNVNTTNNSGNSITNNFASASIASSGSSGTSTTTIVTAQAVIATTAISPGSTFVNKLTMSKSFQLLSVTANGAARIRLYGTAFAQISDLSRGLDVAVAAETTMNVITDVIMDTAPYQWYWQNRVGANADTPQTSTVYITVTNLSMAVGSTAVTITYVPLETP